MQQTQVKLNEKEINELLNVLANKITRLEEEQTDFPKDKYTKSKIKTLNNIYNKIMKNRKYVSDN